MNNRERSITESERLFALTLEGHAGRSHRWRAEVDQVWHLHLMYPIGKICVTRFWVSLFITVATSGGSEEAEKIDQWYQNTLEIYARVFGHQPPTDIWPESAIRFGVDRHYQRVNTKQNWIVRKPRFPEVVKRVTQGLLLKRYQPHIRDTYVQGGRER